MKFKKLGCIFLYYSVSKPEVPRVGVSECFISLGFYLLVTKTNSAFFKQQKNLLKGYWRGSENRLGAGHAARNIFQFGCRTDRREHSSADTPVRWILGHPSSLGL